ncbi:hypothetical protein [Natrinema salsiterrestre]|uniref:Uncharacterized protein n=1 Tax=Natrinema salsiterrestre TaxID=2950540 RepID=A0A9Q4Q5R1_9EURY|nr:hypothetical protein [Natrinema salsiterrestre]MDF9748413.1 hypothetical protein [Natrinema salsiterrestre]
MSIQTADLETAAETVGVHPTVRDARVVEHDTDAVPRALEIVLEREVDRIPPGVLGTLADHDCGVGSVQQQGAFLIAVAK